MQLTLKQAFVNVKHLVDGTLLNKGDRDVADKSLDLIAESLQRYEEMSKMMYSQDEPTPDKCPEVKECNDESEE